MKNPLISIIIPTYNREDISSTLESAINQTYKNIEIIVVDDNKDDNISNKIYNQTKKYNKIIYIKNKTNLGGALSRNEGIKVSKGEFIAFLDDDDEFVNTKLEKQLNYYNKLNNNNISVITCNTKNKLNNKIIGKEKHISINNNVVRFLSHKTATTSTWLVKKSCLLDVGMFNNINAHQEGLLMIKLLDKGYSSYNLNEYLMIRNFHSNNECLSHKDKKYIETTKEFIKLSDEYIKEKDKKKVYYQYHSMLFHLYYLNNDYNNAYNEYKELLKMNPFTLTVIKKIIRLLMLKRGLK